MRLWQSAGVAKERTTGFLPEHVLQVDVVHRAGRDPRVDLGDVGDLVGGRRRDRRCLVADVHRVELADLAGSGNDGAGEAVALLDERGEGPGAGLVERHLGDVDGLARVGVGGRRAGDEGGLGLERLDPGRERADRGALDVLGRGVDGDLGAGDLLALDREDAEGEAVLAHTEHAGRGRHDGALAGRVAEDLLEALALRRGEVGRRRARGARATSLPRRRRRRRRRSPRPPEGPRAAAVRAGKRRGRRIHGWNCRVPRNG